MNAKFRKTLASIGVATVLTFGGATAVFAAESAGGGTWDYGVTSIFPSNNWSNYNHPTREHGSSVTGDNGLVRSSCAAKGTWSKATAWDSNPFRVDHAYWRYCD